MNRRERRAIEHALPSAYRGRTGYRRLLDAATLRVSVSGIRGKSALTEMARRALEERGLVTYAKQTGTDPVSIKQGRRHPIERDPRKKAILDETYWEVKKHWPADALVLENQGITPYTMRVFNELYCRPHYLLITNIRRDHLGDIARTLPRMAVAFVRSAPRGTTIVSGERDEGLRAVMRRAAKKRGVRLIEAAPGRHVVPGFESVTVLDAMLRDWTGKGLTAREKRDTLASLQMAFRWRDSSLPGVLWFHGAEINDVDSTGIVLDHLRRQRRIPTTAIAYLRRDRIDRTASFVSFFKEAFESGRLADAYVAGPGAPQMRQRLRRFANRLHVLSDDPSSIDTLFERLQAAPRPRAVFTMINAVPPWPRAVARRLGQPRTVAVPGQAWSRPAPLVPFRAVVAS